MIGLVLVWKLKDTYKALIEVDGGVNRKTIGPLSEAGVDVFVAGSAVFGAADPAAEVDALRARAE